MNETLLEIKDLMIHYETNSGIVEVANGMNLVLDKGQPLDPVSKTGTGKTTTALGILRPLSESPARTISGRIHFGSRDVLTMDKDTLQKYRGKRVSMIFQDPMISLNLIVIIGEQVMELLEIHEPNPSREELTAKAQKTLEMVGIRGERFNGHPHQFSGGIEQKVVIAIAPCCSPELLITDEPTTALGVTIQVQVLGTICTLRNELQTSMILITYGFDLMVENRDMVAIIYAGEITEYGNLADVFENARHPYIAGLSGCIPNIDKDVHRLEPIKGLVPDPMSLSDGCPFHDRCEYCMEIYRKERPMDLEIAPGHIVKRHLHDTGEEKGSK